MLIKEVVEIKDKGGSLLTYNVDIECNFVFETIGIENIHISAILSKVGRLRYKVLITTDNGDEVFIPSLQMIGKHFKKSQSIIHLSGQVNSVKKYFENDLLVSFEEDKTSKNKGKKEKVPTIHNNKLQKDIGDIFDDMPPLNIFEDIREDVRIQSHLDVYWERVTEKYEDGDYKVKKLYYTNQ